MPQDGNTSRTSDNDAYMTMDERITIQVSEDKLEAVGIIQPATIDGNRLDKQEILLAMEKAGIVYGILHNNIDNYIETRRYDGGIILAQGIPPIDGKDAVIEYKFETNKEKKPKTNDDGTVDFRELDLLNHISMAEILAVLTPAEEGKPGMSIYGKPIRQRFPKKLSLKYGKNVQITEDKLSLYSEKGGYVFLDGEKVTVSEEYVVAGDAGPATGNIVFDGNVTVRGNVNTGYTIEAKGSIRVDGVVEGATLIAGDQIVIARGVQGGNKAVLQANGNIVCSFIEGSIVNSGGYVTANAIMHSKVSAKGDIHVDQKKGLVVGGELMSGTLISVKTAGSALFGTNTLLEVGLPPDMMKQIRQLEKDIADKQKEHMKVKQALDLLSRKMNSPEGLPPDKKAMLPSLTKQSIVLMTDMKQMMTTYGGLKTKLEHYTPGRIKVENIIYPGVKIVISNTSYYVRSELQYCQFIKDGADIRFIPY